MFEFEACEVFKIKILLLQMIVFKTSITKKSDIMDRH